MTSYNLFSLSDFFLLAESHVAVESNRVPGFWVISRCCCGKLSSAKKSLVQFQAAAAVEKYNLAVAYLLNFRSGSLKGDLVNNLFIHTPCFRSAYFIFLQLIPFMMSFVYESLIFVILERLKGFASSFAPYQGLFNILQKKTAYFCCFSVFPMD